MIINIPYIKDIRHRMSEFYINIDDFIEAPTDRMLTNQKSPRGQLAAFTLTLWCGSGNSSEVGWLVEWGFYSSETAGHQPSPHGITGARIPLVIGRISLILFAFHRLV